METELYFTLPSNSSKNFYSGNLVSQFTTKLAQGVRLPEGQRHSIGLAELIFPFEALPDNYPKDLYIYCDLCAYNFVGDETNRFLRVVRIVPKQESYRFSKIYFHSLVDPVFDTIEIVILSQSGERYPFKTSAVPSIIVLCIRSTLV